MTGMDLRQRGLSGSMRTAASGSGHRARLRHAVRSLAVGDVVYAAPASVNKPILGPVVDTNDVALAIDTDDDGIVWVHGADCPDLARAAAHD